MSAGKEVTINSRKYDLSLRRSWKCRLVERKEPLLVFIGEFDETVSHPDLGTIEKGTVSYEYYWLDRWYNIFRFHEPDGKLRNWYCNVNMPPVFYNGVLDYVDLDLDVVIWPDERVEVLDQDEFESNASKFGYPTEVREHARKTVAQLLEMARQRCFPFEA